MPEEPQYWVLTTGQQKGYRNRILKIIGEMHKTFSSLGFTVVESWPNWIGAVLRKGSFWDGTSISVVLIQEDPILFEFEVLKRVKKGKDKQYIRVTKDNLEYFEENIDKLKASIKKVLEESD